MGPRANRIWPVVLAATIVAGCTALWPGTANRQESDVVPIVQAARGYMQFRGCYDVIPKNLFDKGTVTWAAVQPMYDQRLALLNSFATPEGPLYRQLFQGLREAFPGTEAPYLPAVYERSVDYRIEDVRISGDQATVRVKHTDSWGIPVGGRDDTFRSSNGLVSTLTLSRAASGEWLIDRDDSQFIPGEGP